MSLRSFPLRWVKLSLSWTLTQTYHKVVDYTVQPTIRHLRVLVSRTTQHRTPGLHMLIIIGECGVSISGQILSIIQEESNALSEYGQHWH